MKHYCRFYQLDAYQNIEIGIENEKLFMYNRRLTHVCGQDLQNPQILYLLKSW